MVHHGHGSAIGLLLTPLKRTESVQRKREHYAIAPLNDETAERPQSVDLDYTDESIPAMTATNHTYLLIIHSFSS